MNTHKAITEEIRHLKAREAKHKMVVLKAAFGGVLLGAGFLEILVADATVNPSKWTVIGAAQIACGVALVMLTFYRRTGNP